MTSLYERIRTYGTLSEKPSEVPDSKYALPSTINWVRALSILSKEVGLDFKTAQKFYTSTVKARSMQQHEENTICEQLLFCLNQIACLRAVGQTENKADVARTAIVSWYYETYAAAQAMIAGADGTFADNHSTVAYQWDRNFPAKGLALEPFNDRMSDLTDLTIQAKLLAIRGRGKHSLSSSKPQTKEDAWGCVYEYLSGSAEWWQWKIKDQVKESKEFKALKVNSFNTKLARNVRDAVYAKKSMGFMHEAFRYRGKANYRDAIFLSYGKNVPALLSPFIKDLENVLTTFSVMAAAYSSVRMKQYWPTFIDDLEKKKSVSISALEIWS